MEWLQIRQVRNLEETRIHPSPRINLITGRNASGKTALLEAIYLLARARSFRTPRIQEVIQHEADSLGVSSRIRHEQAGTLHTGLEKGYGKLVIKQNGNKLRTISEQAKSLPLVLITQDSRSLISGGPRHRRHWLDWAMFHVEPDYLENWKSYFKAVRHRNSLLKTGNTKVDLYRAWEQEMVKYADQLTQTRKHFLQELSETLAGDVDGLFRAPVVMMLSPGWQEKQSLETVLEVSRRQDQKVGYTRQGPHQADIRFTLENKGLVSTFSRGQLKLFVSFLILAQAKVLQKRSGVAPAVLVDDYRAELDREASVCLLSRLTREEHQIFLTSAEETDRFVGVQQVFHVERGRIDASTGS